MTKSRWFIPASILLLGAIGAGAGEPVNLSGSFDGWQPVGDANWRIENGEFVADGGKGHLVTKESFTDVRIKAEFWVNESANSGIFFRITDPAAPADSSAYEANIFDARPDPKYRTGAVTNFASPTATVNTAGQWNTYDITVQGDRITLVLNGVTTVDTRDATYKSGPISLQYMAGTVKFRNVLIEKL